MTPAEFTRDCAAIGFDVTTLPGQAAAAVLFDSHPRTVRKWARGEIAVNPAAAQLLRLVVALELEGDEAIATVAGMMKAEKRRAARRGDSRAQA